LDRYTSAINRFCDPRDPAFAATRDFGSHSFNFRNIAIEGDTLVATFQVNNVFEAVGKHFSGVNKVEMQTSAVTKVLKDFGYKVNNSESLVERLGALGDESITVEKLIEEGIVIKKAVEPGEWVTDTRFVFQGSKVATQSADSLNLSNILNRQTALKEALADLSTAPRSADEFNKIISNVSQKFDESYTLRGRSAPEVFAEAEELVYGGDYTKAQQLLKELRDSGRGHLRKPSVTPSLPKKAA
jgi:hypothetical protein